MEDLCVTPVLLCVFSSTMLLIQENVRVRWSTVRPIPSQRVVPHEMDVLQVGSLITGLNPSRIVSKHRSGIQTNKITYKSDNICYQPLCVSSSFMAQNSVRADVRRHPP